MGHERPQEAIVRETKRIAVGVCLMVIVMLAIYAGMGQFSLSVLLGGLLGGAYAIFNFFMLGMTVQKATKLQPENAELARMQMKSSYNMRMIGMVIVVVIAFALPFVDGLACLIPMLFPRITIFVLQITGKIKDE